jgi:hypothetical protein
MRTFTISGDAPVGSVVITAADGYEVYMNGQLVGKAQVEGNWMESDHSENFVHNRGWETVEEYDISQYLVTGENTLLVIGAHEYMGPQDGQLEGTVQTNPAGVIFRIHTTAACTNQTGGTPSNNQTGNHTNGNQTTGNQTNPPVNSSGNQTTCDYSLGFTSITNPVAPSGIVTVRGTLTGPGDVSGAQVSVNGMPVGVLLGEWMVDINAPASEGSYAITASYAASCGVVQAAAETLVQTPSIENAGGGALRFKTFGGC